MINIIHFFIKQRLFINLMVGMIMLIGLTILSRMNREAFPDVNFDMMTVLTIYPGGSPDEIEQLVTIPIEKKLREVGGIDKVTSFNIENVSMIVVYIDPDATSTAHKKTVDDVKDAVDSVDNLPDKAERPIVEEITLDKAPAIDISVALAGDKMDDESYRELRKTARALEDYIYEIDGVAEVTKLGYLEREFLVEVNPGSLNQYNIGLNTVINKLATRNLDLPGGVLRLGDKEYLLRTKAQFRNVDDVRKTVILANDAGFGTEIKDISKVSDTFEEADILDRYNAENAIILKVSKKKSADMITITDQIKQALKDFKPPTDRELEINYFNDFSRTVRDRLSSLMINAATGFVLLGIILFALLGFRLSNIVGMAIPVTFMVAFIGMQVAGITINVISMFALVMVLGMIVDFSIVVAENSYRHMEEGWDRKKAVEKGTAEVFWPLTVTLLAIAAAFGPLLFMTGIVGKFVIAIPIVIIICLTASWFAAMFILPSHLETFAKVTSKEAKAAKGKKDGFEVFQNLYRKFLSSALRHRYLTLLVLIGLFFGSLFVAGAFLGFVFFPDKGGETVEIRTKMPQGTTLKANLENIKKIEQVVLQLPMRQKDENGIITEMGELSSLHTRVGEEASSGLNVRPTEGTHRGTLIVHLTPAGERERDAKEIRDELREKVTALQENGVISKDLYLDFRVQAGGPPVGLPINVEVRGDDFGTLQKIGEEYLAYLSKIEGVFDARIDLEPGKEEYRYRINENLAARAKVSVMDVARALNSSFEGAVATTINIGEDEVDVRVRFPDWARQQRRSLNRVMVANAQGGLVPLSLVATYDKQPGYAEINRLDYKRVVVISANVDTDKVTSLQVNQKLAEDFADIASRYPGYSVNYGGQQEESQKSMANLAVLFLFALFLIYIILSSFFRSLILPTVVMSAIPFALVGVIFALFAHGEPLSFMSTLGVVSLAGVIVSNTLVLVQFINNLRDEGYSLFDALVEGGAIRLRPVLLTSGTTVLGLFPTIYGLGGEDAFVAPLALAFGYGLIFATFITLVLVPAFYHIAEDIKGVLVKIPALVGIEMAPELHIKDEDEGPAEV